MMKERDAFILKWHMMQWQSSGKLHSLGYDVIQKALKRLGPVAPWKNMPLRS